MNSVTDTAKSGGLPHSEIPGSTIARISPGLIAACHVLHRLSTPRHSPDALDYLFSTPHQRPTRARPAWPKAMRDDSLVELSAFGLLELGFPNPTRPWSIDNPTNTRPSPVQSPTGRERRPASSSTHPRSTKIGGFDRASRASQARTTGTGFSTRADRPSGHTVIKDDTIR